MEGNIIFEDNDIIVLNKPFGMLSQKDKKGEQHNLYNLVENYILKKDKNAKVGLIHRLDRGVGGLIVFGKNEIANRNLSEQMQNGDFSKFYLTIVEGDVKNEDFLNDWIMKNQRLNISKIVNKNNSGSKEAKLFYKKVSQIKKNEKLLSLLEIEIFTGRSHQIRVQLANNNTPIYKDTKYNKNFLKKRLGGYIPLFSYKIKFKHPTLNTEKQFKILPSGIEEFDQFIMEKLELI